MTTKTNQSNHAGQHEESTSLEVTSAGAGIDLGGKGTKTPEQLAAFADMAKNLLALDKPTVQTLTSLVPWAQGVDTRLSNADDRITKLLTVAEGTQRSVDNLSNQVSRQARIQNDAMEVLSALNPEKVAEIQGTHLEEGVWESTKRTLGRPVTHGRALAYGVGGFAAYRLGGWAIPKVKGFFSKKPATPADVTAMPVPPPVRR